MSSHPIFYFILLFFVAACEVGVPGVANRLFGTLEKSGVNVVLISQASSEHTITFATRQDQAMSAKQVLHDEFYREIEANLISDIYVKQPCSIIAAVGDGYVWFLCDVQKNHLGGGNICVHRFLENHFLPVNSHEEES